MTKTFLPPGFRFHPTDVELVWYYLKRRIMGKHFRFEAISEVELYKFAPWDLPEKSCLQSRDLEWYFFCPRDRKYSHGSRTNRSTDIGYWKTTGRDRSIDHNSQTVGMKKTLIFHLGKPPQGSRTNWVMYEFRLESKDLVNAGYAQDTHVICKNFQKSGPGPKSGEQYGAPYKEEDWEDEDMEDAGSFPIFSSVENAHLFPPVPQQSVACEVRGASSTLNAGAPSYVPSNFEVGEPSHAQQLPGAVDCSLHCSGELGETSYMLEPYADGMSLEQLEALLNSSPLHSDNVNGKMVDDFTPMPELEADYMYRDLVDLSAQQLPEPTDGTVSYTNTSPDLEFQRTFHEFANDHYVAISDIGFADKRNPVELVATGKSQHKFTNTSSHGLVNIYPGNVVDAYRSSEPTLNMADNQFPSNLEDDHL